jgi:predicted  nucleic acid-binding Zn-ribbon protein
MADPAPIGSDVSAGTYRCTNCGNQITVQSVESLPPCPSCGGPNDWNAVSGADSADDPYPDRN